MSDHLIPAVRATERDGAEIRFLDLDTPYRLLKHDILRAMETVLDSHAFIHGPPVAALEHALAEHTGAAHVVTVASGTDALYLAMLAQGIGPGDAVFVPAYTYCATVNAVMHTGATPVLVDVDPDTFNIDVRDLCRRLDTLDPTLRPRLIMAVDIFGLPADYPALHALAAKEGLLLMADAAQSFGASLNGTPCGRLAPVTATSFYPTKPLGGYGDGGAILTDDAELAAHCRSLRWHGMDDSRTESLRPGTNSRLDTLQAAVLLAKLRLFHGEHAAREQMAAHYAACLHDSEAIRPQQIPEGYRSGWAHYTVRTPNAAHLADKLDTAGIPFKRYYQQPLHWQPAFRHLAPDGGLPVTEQLAKEGLTLPMHPYLTTGQVESVCEVLAG
ncbi:MAG: hypothetical protein C0462_08570 [Alcanivorax sp.]|nr:hypothetical protein [Alcanivorax sp.]